MSSCRDGLSKRSLVSLCARVCRHQWFAASIIKRVASDSVSLFASARTRADDSIAAQRRTLGMAAQPRVAGLVHLVHAARADGREDLVGAEFVAC
jgi:hypothetical protein